MLKTLVVLAALISGVAHAQLFRCESGGAVTYQQEPCPGGRAVVVPPPPTPADAERARFELAISRGNVILGMSAAQVRRAWGEPDRINRSTSANYVREQWVYRGARRHNDAYAYLENGVLVSAQTSE